jgi:hypothetical protein
MTGHVWSGAAARVPAHRQVFVTMPDGRTIEVDPDGRAAVTSFQLNHRQRAQEAWLPWFLTFLRDRLIRNRTQLANAIRGYAAEFGLAAAKGISHLVPLLDRIQADEIEVWYE